MRPYILFRKKCEHTKIQKTQNNFCIILYSRNGDCVKKGTKNVIVQPNKKATTKRCPKGSRKNKKGECVKTRKSVTPKKSSLKFYSAKSYKSPTPKNSTRSVSANYSMSASDSDRFMTPRERGYVNSRS